MNHHSPRRAALLLALSALSCHVDRDAIQQQVFSCDPKTVDPGCGTDQQGQGMMCFAGRPLGGTDFCAERCPLDAQGMPVPGQGGVCAQSGARLDTCNLAPGGDAECRNPALGCFRNNVLSDTGVCLTITPCTTDDQCRDPVRSVCASTFVKKIYQTPESLKNDHLWCLQAGCQERRTACSPGESCLRDLIPPSANPPDICVPDCDSNLRCPPAHECYRKTGGPAAPAICIPGLLGFGCDATIDCMMGECISIGQNLTKICSTKCSSDADCARYDGEQGQFLCNEDHQCIPPTALTGSICYSDSDCQSGLTCAYLDASSPTGSCLPPCGADGSCAPRAGIPHTCLPRADTKGNVCFPGFFGYPCSSDSACLPSLTCRSLGSGQPSICTNLCADDTDCAKNRWSAAGYCQELKDMAIKVCVDPRNAGEPCERDAQCSSKRCLTRTDGTRACAPAGGSR
jgi:hypothetical protein